MSGNYSSRSKTSAAAFRQARATCFVPLVSDTAPINLALGWDSQSPARLCGRTQVRSPYAICLAGAVYSSSKCHWWRPTSALLRPWIERSTNRSATTKARGSPATAYC